MTKDQLVTERYAIYNSDCMYVMPTLPDESIDLSVYSPPFAGLYNYSSSENDFSNCESRDQFLEQYDFLISEISRLTKPGRITAVHCTDIIDNKTCSLWDFPHEIIELHKKHGMEYKNRITIWKEPLKVRMRTMVRSLMHKLIVEDSTECFPAMPDYMLIFKKTGENKIPVVHPLGLQEYFGETPILPMMEEKYGRFEDLKKNTKVTKIRKQINYRILSGKDMPQVFGMIYGLIMFYPSEIQKMKMMKSTFTLCSLM